MTLEEEIADRIRRLKSELPLLSTFIPRRYLYLYRTERHDIIRITEELDDWCVAYCADEPRLCLMNYWERPIRLYRSMNLYHGHNIARWFSLNEPEMALFHPGEKSVIPFFTFYDEKDQMLFKMLIS